MLGPIYTTVGQIRLANISNGQMTNIDSSIISVSLDYSMTMASELRFTVIDFNNDMTKKNYFSIGRDVIYTTHTACTLNDINGPLVSSSKPSYINLLFEIAEVTISQGPGNTPQVEVVCYSKAIQQMKRDRKPGQIKGTGSDYVKRAARKYGLRCFAEKSSKKVSINKASGDEQAESLWDVLSGIANEAKFVLFEADGILFFASQKFLLNKWGSNSYRVEQKGKKGKPSKFITERSIPIVNWKDSWTVNQGSVFGTSATAPAFELIDYPNFTRSANDPLDVTGSFSIARENGSKFRPGMTIQLLGFPGEVDDNYLIDSVSFQDREPDPVQVTFRKPEKKPKDIKEIAIGRRIKQRSVQAVPGNDFILFDLVIDSKNSKNKRPDTVADNIRNTLGFTSVDLPPNRVSDPRVLPLPSVLNQQVFPRYDTLSNAGSPKLLQTGNIDMYSRPTKVVDGKVVTIAPLIVENVVEPGFNNDNSYVAIVPKLFVDESGEPQIYSDATASTSFISAMAGNSSADFIAKMADLESASDYVKLINHQQVLVMTSRFKSTNIPDTSIYPLPTEAEQQNYPYMSTLVSAGDMDLYSLPAGKVKGVPTTFAPYLYWNGANVIIVSGLKQSGNKVILLTQSKAFDEDGNRKFGTCSKNDFKIYVQLLKEQQEIILNQRFAGDFSSIEEVQ